MANEIMSVEGQLVGMPLAGPESFSQQQLDYLKRALGVDETVLWENASGVTGASFPIPLSDAPSNFERIRLEFKPWSSRVMEFEFPGSESSFLIGSVWCDLSMSSIYDFATIFTVNNLTLEFGGNKFIQWGKTTVNSDNSTFRLYKVVGVHRIAGGN